jgi:hypothetical protein
MPMQSLELAGPPRAAGDAIERTLHRVCPCSVGKIVAQYANDVRPSKEATQIAGVDSEWVQA